MSIQQDILDATKYKREVGELRFSASMFSNTDLQNFLTVVYGAEEPTEIGQATIGNIAHKGMEEIYRGVKNTQVEEDYRIENYEGTGWALTGTADLVVTEPDIVNVHDYKFTKLYAGTSVKKDLRHGYRMQLNTLKHIIEQVKGYKPEAIKMYLEMFYKDADILYLQKSYEQIEVKDIPDIKDLILAKINSLDALIKGGEMPPECSTKDLWFRKLKNGNTVRSRCQAYCSVAHVCPYYNPPSSKQTISNW